MRACGGQGVFRPERNGARPRAGPCAGTVPAAPARNGTAETEERYAAARAESQKKQPALHDILAGGPPGMPFFATARACRTRGGERRERRAVAKKAGCACRALRDRARGGCRSLSGKMRSLARPLCGRAEARAKGCEGCRATARTKGGRKRRGTGEPCRRRAFPTGRRAYAVGGRRVSFSSRAISSGVRRRRRNS